MRHPSKKSERSIADKLKTSEDNNNNLALEKVADNYIAQIKDLEDEKKSLQELKEISTKDSMEWQKKKKKKNLILQETNVRMKSILRKSHFSTRSRTISNRSRDPA